MNHCRSLQDGLLDAMGNAVRRLTCRHGVKRNIHGLLWILLLLFFAVVPVVAADFNPFFREDFDSLARWEPLTFPKIKAHSTYTVVKEWGRPSKAVYGQYPPHSTLNYVWTGRSISERIIQSPYTEKAFMVVLEKGKERAGQWVEESVNVLEDYRIGRHEPGISYDISDD